jgi:hypothetical protein
MMKNNGNDPERKLLHALTGFIFSLLFAVATVYAIEPADEKWLDEVAERGAHVMPFDLEKTVHIFSKTANGGIQQVIAKDKSDAAQIKLIRDHLLEISEEFSRGDFAKPEHIHGQTMQGLAVLKTAGPDQLKIEYLELPDGAQITYSTQLPRFINALHLWFDAQLSDHARHAVPGHTHKHMHH